MPDTIHKETRSSSSETNQMIANIKHSQISVGLSALKVVLKASVGALLRLSVLGKRTFFAAKEVVPALLSYLFVRIEVLMIYTVS